jgi:hypothetical protein
MSSLSTTQDFLCFGDLAITLLIVTLHESRSRCKFLQHRLQHGTTVRTGRGQWTAGKDERISSGTSKRTTFLNQGVADSSPHSDVDKQIEGLSGTKERFGQSCSPNIRFDHSWSQTRKAFLYWHPIPMNSLPTGDIAREIHQLCNSHANAQNIGFESTGFPNQFSSERESVFENDVSAAVWAGWNDTPNQYLARVCSDHSTGDLGATDIQTDCTG